MKKTNELKRPEQYENKEKSGPKYIVITSAIREKANVSNFPAEVEKESYEYRKGDLGLLHPEIVDFYSDFENNIRKCAEGLEPFDECIRRKGAMQIIPKSGITVDLYRHDVKDIPILLYDGSLLWGGHPSSGKDLGFFIVPLRAKEYKEIEGTELERVKQGVKRIYDGEGISLSLAHGRPSQEETLDRAVTKQWMQLSNFKALMGNKIGTRMDEIPIEVAPIKISKKSIEHHLEYLKQIEENERKRKIPTPVRYISV